MVERPPANARFGDFTLDVALRQLRGPSGDIHLSTKAFDLLTLLVNNRSRILSKTELHEQLWPGTFVVDANLASLVAEIREALDDDARQPRFVRTAHRVGYGFCGAVNESVGTASPTTMGLCWLLKDGRRLMLRSGENILGRDVDGAIDLDSPSVSRRHARIVVTQDQATIEDLDSKNGTYVRRRRVSTVVRLADGDDLRLGSVGLKFRRRSTSGSTMTVSSTKSRRS
jgi:DNA-binding winged helix-turn-helix (wHTH) protein